MAGKNHADNSQVVDEQRAEAAQAAAKEKARQDRLTQGLAAIKGAFEGAPTMATKAFDWGSFKPTTNEAERQYEAAGGTSATSGQQLYNGGLPAGYTIRKAAGGTGGTANAPASRFQPATSSPTASSASRKFMTMGPNGVMVPQGEAVSTGIKTGNTDTTMAGWGGTPADPAFGAGGGGDQWEIVGPDGKVHKQGDAFDISSPDGGHSGGFDDAFYNKYKQSVLDYYMPQVDKQYGDARKELTYRLGRSGILNSSAANDATADLVSQNTINQAGVRNQADTAEGDLRTQVASERAKATSQLYATEDPEVAANQALSSVRDISLQQPSLSPLSALFDVATVGGANVLKGYNNAKLSNSFNTALAKANAGRVVPS